MLPLIVFIVLLSFIGIYINVFKSANLTDPELLKLPTLFRSNLGQMEPLDFSEMSGDALAAKLVQEKLANTDIYDSVGNFVKGNKNFENPGMTPGVIAIDTNVEKLSSIGTKRPYAWHGASSEREWPDNKTVNAGLPYNVYHPLDKESLKTISSGDVKSVHHKMTGPDIKAGAGEQTVGVFLGKTETYDTLEKRKSNKDITQAIAIIRNATANQNKTLLSLDTVDRSKTGERYGEKNNNAISSFTEIKMVPNINVSMTEKDVSNIASRSVHIDPTGELIRQTAEYISK